LYTNQGEITECPRNNFFVFRDGSLITPADKILPGITRKVVIQLAAGEFPVEERCLTITELEECQEAFITSTSKEILPVTQIDDQILGSGNVGELTERMMTLFQHYVTNY
jgi:branched-subunit amino acid aminotransferase/4-amino-4-deoxychorismate lyase